MKTEHMRGWALSALTLRATDLAETPKEDSAYWARKAERLYGAAVMAFELELITSEEFKVFNEKARIE